MDVIPNFQKVELII